MRHAYQLEDQITIVADVLAENDIQVSNFNLQQLMQKTAGELRRLYRYDQLAKELGYSSVENMGKALKMVRTKDKKNFYYYEKKLHPSLIDLPSELLFVEKLGDRSKIQKFILEALYPTFEIFLATEGTNLDELIEKWREVESLDSLIDLNNWCVKQIINNKSSTEDQEDSEFWEEALAAHLRAIKDVSL